jgi:hypothetical protein
VQAAAEFRKQPRYSANFVVYATAECAIAQVQTLLAILQPAGIGYSVALAMTETQEPAAPAPAEEKIPLRTELAVYGVGTFSTTAHFMLLVIIPIWAIEKMQIPTGLLLGFVPAP